MGEIGLLGVTLPETFGGAGLNYVSYGLIAREIERVDSGYRSMMSVQSSLVMLPIHQFGTYAQRQKYLPPLARGEWIGCFGLTEPDHGSDPGGMVTRARSVPGGYRLSGAKTWISHSPFADVFVVWAKTDDEAIRGFHPREGLKGLSHAGAARQGRLAGVDHRPGAHGSRFRAGGEPAARRDGVAGPVYLPGAPRGSAFPGVRWAPRRAAGTRRASTVLDRKYSRRAAGRQSVDPEEAGVACRPRSLLALQSRLRLGRMKDEGSAAAEITLLLKRNSCGKALEVARAARDMLGGNGISDEYGVIRHLVNLEVVNTYEGTHDIFTLLILGRAQTGIQAFY